jgi:hypothetical protein
MHGSRTCAADLWTSAHYRFGKIGVICRAMTKSVFDLTFEELADFGRQASAEAIRQAQEAGVPVATLAASNVTPIKAKRIAAKPPVKRVAAARARKGA